MCAKKVHHLECFAIHPMYKILWGMLKNALKPYKKQLDSYRCTKRCLFTVDSTFAFCVRL